MKDISSSVISFLNELKPIGWLTSIAIDFKFVNVFNYCLASG